MKISAGILLFTDTSIFLVHPAGPYFYNRDDGCWSVPKGILDGDENSIEAAIREFSEETGLTLPYDHSSYIDLGEVRNRYSKTVRCFAKKTEGKERFIKCNMFKLEWPEGSGNIQEFPECDRGEWFTFEQARKKLIAYQHPFIDRIEKIIK